MKADGPLLIAYDGSEHAKDAIGSAAGLFSVKEALVLTVWQPTSDVGAFAWYGAGPNVVNAADLHDAAAIVMGSRGLTGLRSMLLGSVSNAVVHHADRPTLVIHRPGDDHDD